MADKTQELILQVQQCVRQYLDTLDGYYESANLRDTVLVLCESAMLDEVLRITDGNLTKAALILGVSRGTLRKKLKGSQSD